MQLKSRPAALIAAGIVTTIGVIGLRSGWTGHEQTTAAQISESSAVGRGYLKGAVGSVIDPLERLAI